MNQSATTGYFARKAEKFNAMPTISEKQMIARSRKGASIGLYTGFTININGVTHQCVGDWSF